MLEVTTKHQILQPLSGNLAFGIQEPVNIFYVFMYGYLCLCCTVHHAPGNVWSSGDPLGRETIAGTLNGVDNEHVYIIRPLVIKTTGSI